MASFFDDFNRELSVDHLSLEAIAALVDNELSPKAEHRAKVHLVHCEQCREEVNAQRAAAERIRGHDVAVHASGSLMEKLARIPEAASAASREHEAAKKTKRTFASDGCRRPETLADRVGLILRRFSQH
ncbi:zf-HC2 domain-containing protein [uncultured Corynebacterium sp.]|uniref:zf-HC2 domain-containing protein n=1 Tax=uncultured Corynebacterium sp. TaxID=159447 RepID=UPI0025D3231F|nr:zf-HC2 domain-containing protein [uncultured Corynebacterium sp.]